MTRNILVIALLAFSFCISSAWACTDVRVTAKDGTIIIGRTLEFALDLKSQLVTSPRGRVISTMLPSNKPGMSWKGKYGYVFLDGLGTGRVVEGMNEQGLSFEALYLPNETEYQTPPAGQESHSIPYLSSGDWILGNFKTVDEVKAALPSIYIYAETIPQANMVFPLHFAVFDTTGKGIVIEFVKGKMNVYDNPVGVMTNAPTFNWQVTNLRNYINLLPTTPQPIVTKNITFIATGQGSGMHGLPGDVSPPSRFVKMCVMLRSIITPANAEEALNVAQHIINNVDIPLGYVRSDVDINSTSNEYTQWTVFKDLTHKKFYYHTYGDTALHMVDMNKLNFAENAPQLKLSIDSKQNIIDMTQALQASK